MSKKKKGEQRQSPLDDREIEIAVLGVDGVSVVRRVKHSEMFRKRSLSRRASDAFDQLRQAMDGEDDRIVVLVFNAFLEDYIGRVLAEMLQHGNATERLLSPNEMLGPFGARIKMCEAIGLLTTPEANNLRRLASIRNAIAHGWEITTLQEVDEKGFPRKGESQRDSYLAMVMEAHAALSRASLRTRRLMPPTDGPVHIPWSHVPDLFTPGHVERLAKLLANARQQHHKQSPPPAVGERHERTVTPQLSDLE